MDVRLPDMRGTEAARILRQDKDTRDIPIVFVTTSVMAEDREEFKDIANSLFIPDGHPKSPSRGHFKIPHLSVLKN